VAVTDEQRAMLQLLLEGGQGYEDIGSLLGIAPDEVRSRARTALTEIGGADPDAQVGLSDYLLGQADPIGRADAVRYLQGDPEANALAQRLVQNLRLLAPKASLPEIPEPRGGRRAVAPAPAPTSPSPATTPAAPAPPPATPAAPKGPGFASRAAGFFSGLGSLSGKRRTQAIVGGAAALVIAVVAIVIATSGGGGGDDGTDCAPVGNSAAQTSIANSTLSAVGAAADQDCKPSGVVSLVPLGQQKNGKSQLAGFAFQTKAAHLKPTSDGNVYVLWIDGGNGQARALGRETVSADGSLTGAAPLAGSDLSLLQSGSFRLSLVTQAQTQQIQRELQSQGKRPTGLVPFVGTAVLQGSGAALIQQFQQVLQQVQQQSGASGGQTQGGSQSGSGAAKGSKG
jgi:hypothetical protein